MGNDEMKVWEVTKQVRLQKLHECRGVGVYIVRSGSMKISVDRSGYMNHRRDFQLNHRLIEWIPAAVRQRLGCPISPTGARIEVASDETKIQHTSPQLINRASD